MDSENASPPRALYTATGVMEWNGATEVLSGILLALDEDEARGLHIRWMQRQQPGFLVHSCNVWRVPDELVLEAARGIARAA